MIRLAAPFAGMILALMLPLGGLQAPGSIEGSVVATGSSVPVPRAALTLETAGGREVAKLTASIDGRFSIASLPPGEYRIVASQDGFVSNTRGSQVTVISGRKADLSVGIVPDGAISGRVVDWDGIPVVGIQVQALTFKQDARGRRTLNVVKTTQTNDLGEYRLYWLPPGPYFVDADTMVSGNVSIGNFSNPLPGQRLSMQLIPAYFPNVVDASAATRIDVKAGETFTGAGIRLIDLSKRSISGVVSVLSIRGSTIVDLTPRNLASGLRPQTTSANSNGTFRFFNVVPGSYVLTAEATNADGQETFGSMPIDIGNRDIENLSLAMNTGFDLRIRLTIEGRSRRSDDPQLVVNLRPLISETPFPTVEQSGNDELLMRHVMVGDYSVGVLSLRTSPNVSVSPSNGGLYLKSARFGAADILAGGLHIDGPPSGVLDIVVADGAGSLSGSVLDDRNQPASRMTVVLVPDPPFRGRTDLYKSAITDTSGKFDMVGITPGQYKAFSWETAIDGEWQYADFMELYENRGLPIRIDGGRQDPISVQLIPPRD